MARIRGKITHWNRRKAYGFITPREETKEVFVHISEFKDRREMPDLKQWVEFSMSTDQQGRPCATEVVKLDESAVHESEQNGKLMWTVAVVVLVAAAAGAWFLLR